jgi:hypothetical protein
VNQIPREMRKVVPTSRAPQAGILVGSPSSLPMVATKLRRRRCVAVSILLDSMPLIRND